MEFSVTSKISRLTYCQIEYGGKNGYGNIYCSFYNVLPIIDSCIISNSSSDGIHSIYPSSSVVFNIHNCTISDNDGYAVSTVPMIDMENNTFYGNHKDEICIFGCQNNVLGISQDITWRNQGIPYLITTGNLLIGDSSLGAGKLTIEAGVTVKFDEKKSIIIGDPNINTINGCLQAKGTEGAYITFTSNQLSANPGDWGYIKFAELSQNSYLRYCKIEYAGNDGSAKPAIWCAGSAPEIYNVDISNVYSHGIMCEPNSGMNIPSSATITYTTIIAGTTSCEVDASAIFSRQSYPWIGSSTLMKSKYGIYCEAPSLPSFYPTIINSNIIGNTGFGVYNYNDNYGTVTARYNWWGSSTGPYHNPNNLNGGGDWVSAGVDYSNWIGTDKVPPSPITLKIWDKESVKVDTVILHWLPTGDDFTVGTPTYYVINYATTSIGTVNWGKVPGSKTLNPNQISMEDKEGKSYYCYSVGPLIPMTSYFFSIKAVDDAGNWSNLSNCVGTTTNATFERPVIQPTISNGNTWVKMTIENRDIKEAGIWLFYGTRTPVSSADYIKRIDIGTLSSPGSTETTVSNLTNGQVYYFVAYAYDPGSKTNQVLWSPKSEQVTGNPTVISTVTITGATKTIVGGTVTYTVQGYGSFGDELTNLAYTWNRTPISLGTFSDVNNSCPNFYVGTKTMSGILTVQVTDGGATITTHLSITLLAGTPTTVWILDKSGVSVTGATTTAGGSLFFMGSGTDTYGNPVDTFENYSWQTTIGTITPTGTSTTLTGNKASIGTLTLKADGTQTSIEVTIYPTTTTKFIFADIPSPQKLAVPFDITLNSADEFDNLTQDNNITGTVSLTISNGTTTFMSLTSGVGTKSLSLNLPGSYTIYARGTFTNVLEGMSNPFFVETGTPTQFIFSMPTGTISVSAVGTTTITAYLADNNGFPVGTAGVECTLSVNILTGNAGTLGTTTVLTDANGQITTTYQVGTKSGSAVEIVLTTSAFGTITGTSSVIITKSGPLAKFKFDEIDVQTAGVSFCGTITAKDAYDNTADEFNGTASLSVFGFPPIIGTITPCQTGTFTNGIWAGSMTITTAFATVTIIATYSINVAGFSNLFCVIPGPLHHINLTPDYATTTIEGTISFTCQGKDEYNNDIEGLTYTWESILPLIFITHRYTE